VPQLAHPPRASTAASTARQRSCASALSVMCKTGMGASCLSGDGCWESLLQHGKQQGNSGGTNARC
jgi:hypothetical protein